jgi:hypothetical protein
MPWGAACSWRWMRAAWRRVYDARACAVVASHIDALVLLSSQRKPDGGAVKFLIEELEQAVARIPLRPIQEDL